MASSNGAVAVAEIKPKSDDASGIASPVVDRTPKDEPTNGRFSSDGKVELERLRLMMLLRRFEESTYREYTQPRTLEDGTKEMKIGGFCHLYSGQEAIAVGIAALWNKDKGDQLINAYRCHGHSLALGMDPQVAMAELFGKYTGCSKGKGGSMHLFDADAGNNGGHGIVGGHLPVAAGIAFAQKYKNTDGVTWCMFGDGAINQGTHNEALNLASLWKLPVIWVIENNGVAMGTQIERHSAEEDLAKRGLGYDMPTVNVDANDLDTVITEFGKAVDRARAGEGPTYISANTYRFRGHSMSDPLKYRSKEEAESAKDRDPITVYEVKLREAGFLDDEKAQAMDKEIRQIVKDAIKQADADPHPPLDSRWDDILSENYPFTA
ncbi:MAG: thiamine pyrophosphate-dependent enzyme [Planctomycetota bacterium]